MPPMRHAKGRSMVHSATVGGPRRELLAFRRWAMSFSSVGVRERAGMEIDRLPPGAMACSAGGG
jgi:hypothetical protein